MKNFNKRKQLISELIDLRSKYKKVLSFYREIYDIYEQQHNMGIKYKVTNEIGILDRMIEMLKWAFEKEEKLLRMLFQ